MLRSVARDNLGERTACQWFKTDVCQVFLLSIIQLRLPGYSLRGIRLIRFTICGGICLFVVLEGWSRVGAAAAEQLNEQQRDASNWFPEWLQNSTFGEFCKGAVAFGRFERVALSRGESWEKGGGLRA